MLSVSFRQARGEEGRARLCVQNFHQEIHVSRSFTFTDQGRKSNSGSWSLKINFKVLITFYEHVEQRRKERQWSEISTGKKKRRLFSGFAADFHGGNAFLMLLPHSCDSPLMWLLCRKSAFIFGSVQACGGLAAADSRISCSEKQQQQQQQPPPPYSHRSTSFQLSRSLLPSRGHVEKTSRACFWISSNT